MRDVNGKKTHTPGWPSSCGSASCTSYLVLVRHLVTRAKIHVFSSVSPPAPLLGGGWNATLRPSCSGSLSARPSFLTFGSRELAPLGPTEPLAGSVIETEFFTGLCPEDAGVPGEGARGRLLRFSGQIFRLSVLETLEIPAWWKCLRRLPECY